MGRKYFVALLDSDGNHLLGGEFFAGTKTLCLLRIADAWASQIEQIDFHSIHIKEIKH